MVHNTLGKQEIAALQPELLILPSEINSNVKPPVATSVEDTVPGEDVNAPIKLDGFAPTPLYILSVSEPSNEKALNVTLVILVLSDGTIDNIPFSSSP